MEDQQEDYCPTCGKSLDVFEFSSVIGECMICSRQRACRWAKDNPGRNTAKTVLYYTRQLRATPPWLTKEQIEEIKQFYINCPKGYHVDHIYSLKGKGSCGLHVPWNLQYLTASENVRKSNHIEPLGSINIWR